MIYNNKYRILYVLIVGAYPQMGSVYMGKNINLEQELINLKLEKRKLVLAGKDTTNLDKAIKEVQEKIKESN